MTDTEFTALCNKLGDQSLPEGERWKSIKYAGVFGNSRVLEVQRLFNENRLYLVDDPNFGKSFIYFDTPIADYEVTNCQEKTVSVIPLEKFDQFIFGCNYDVIDIYDLMNTIDEDANFDKPVIIKMPRVYVLTKNELSDPSAIEVAFNRALTADDYEMKITDSEGSEYTTLTDLDVGSYTLTVTCKNGYTGEKTAKIVVKY